MTQRRDEIDVFAVSCGEPTKALLRSALRCQDVGDLAAAARIAADQVAKRPVTRWGALLLALEATELRFAGAVKLSTPPHRYDLHSDKEAWGPFTLTTYPERVRIVLHVERASDHYRLRSTGARAASSYDPMVKDALRELAKELSAHLGATIALERA